MISITTFLLAQTTAPTSQPVPWYAALFNSGPLPMLIIVVVVFYFLMMKSKRGQEKEREGMLKNMKKNDRIRTIGGMLGTVVEVRDDEVLVKVDETSNTKIRFVRSAIHAVVSRDKEKTE
ncbi:MAG: preprotein translocase subunit YajC [Tepidisphaerales bacterium]